MAMWSMADFWRLAVLVLVGFGVARWVLSGENRGRRWGLAALLAAACLPLWVNGAVGIVGNEQNPVNRLFFVVSGFALGGALLVKFRTAGLVRVAVLSAALHVAVIVLVWLRGADSAPWPAWLLAAPWLVAAALLRRAGRLA